MERSISNGPHSFFFIVFFWVAPLGAEIFSNGLTPGDDKGRVRACLRVREIGHNLGVRFEREPFFAHGACFVLSSLRLRSSLVREEK